MTSRLINVAVENYQSIGAASVEIGGLTVIVGRGNLGKSALLRAMCAALFNETGTSFIRQGTKKTTVTLDFEGDQSVVWMKDEKTARYDVTVAGAEMPFTKLAGKVPTELEDMFGIRNIEIDSTFSIRPQIHGQFDAPLLLAESAAKAARALGKLTKLEGILSAQQAAARDLRRVSSDFKSRSREVDELKARLAELPDLEKLDAIVHEARECLKEADEQIDRIAAAEDNLAAYEEAKRIYTIPVPEIGDLDTLNETLSKLSAALEVRRVFLKAKSDVETTKKALTAANLVQQSAEADLETFLEALGICPVCGQTITKEHSDV